MVALYPKGKFEYMAFFFLLELKTTTSEKVV